MSEGAHVRVNRRLWNEDADDYQRRNAPQIRDQAFTGHLAWGTWNIPESELGVLGDVAGKDILEFGCGGAQWSTALHRNGARPFGFDLSDPVHPHEVASFVPPPTPPPRQTAATAQNGRRDMPVVWGVFPWKDMVLASDMNSGLWVFRVTDDADGNGKAAPPPPAAPATVTAPVPAETDDPGGLLWVGLTGLALGLLAVGAVLASARRRRRS